MGEVMLKVENGKFREKFTEINIRQRMYQKDNFITLMITTEFYPSLVDDKVIHGVVEIKLDISGIFSLDDLVGKSYQGDIGSIVISVYNDGIWEHQTLDNFSITITKRMGRELSFKLKAKGLVLNTTGVLVSLYTTSTSKEQLSKMFKLDDFYDYPVIKKVGKSEILKYFIKE